MENHLVNYGNSDPMCTCAISSCKLRARFRPRSGPLCVQPIEEQLKVRLNLLLGCKELCKNWKHVVNCALTEPKKKEENKRANFKTERKGLKPKMRAENR